jgi:hypothetical protein
MNRNGKTVEFRAAMARMPINPAGIGGKAQTGERQWQSS